MTDKKDWGGARCGAGRPKQPNAKKQISVALPPGLLAKIDRSADVSGKSRSDVLAIALATVDFENLFLTPSGGHDPASSKPASILGGETSS